MADDNYKKYTENARRGIKGEAFFESLIVDHAIPHRIARQNDLGIDFLCEWVYGDRPRGFLFLVQVKCTTSEHIKSEFISQSRLNGLDIYKLKGAKKVDERTINYWKGLGLPAFLFIIIENRLNEKSDLECYYKRYTPLLDDRSSPDDEDGTKSFHRANNGGRFLAFANPESEIGGFARDLIIDYVRLSYSRGHILQLTPEQLGFWPFPNKDNPEAAHFFSDIFKWNRGKFEETYEWMKILLSKIK